MFLYFRGPTERSRRKRSLWIPGSAGLYCMGSCKMNRPTFGNGNVIVVPDDSQFDVEMERAGRRLVVVDFTASWCGPCQRIAPVFVNLSVKYVDAVFLKVDVDQCQNTAESRGVRAMPTFQFYQIKTKLDEIRGADPVALDNKIRQLISAQPKEDTDGIIDSKRVDSCNFSDHLSDKCDVNQPKVVLQLDLSELLLKFASNIIDDRKTPLQKGDIFAQKILSSVEGGLDCLIDIGSKNQHAAFPTEMTLDALLTLRDTIHDERTRRGTHTPPSSTGQYPLPQARMTPSQRQFHAKLKSSSETVMLYEVPEFQRQARSHIPVAELERKAQEMSETSKKGGSEGVSARDCLILVLVEWYNGFFSWTKTPKCKSCGVEGTYQGLVAPTSEEKKWMPGSVEHYVCPKCKKCIRYPRYNHPAKLLETRCGRCGECANCFTFCCRAMGFDSRLVLDWTDHVWTEVFSESQQRWIHCDYGTCDNPLLYEASWGKKFTYIIAFSGEEVLDVTWRYSANHEQVRQRRHEVSEQWLTNITMQLTQQLQKGLPLERRKLLDARMKKEKEELKTLTSATPEELRDRKCGSMAWRKFRGN